jgi:hypothetical protein
VISDITGVSGQAIIAAILKGERDPWKLADLKHEMVRASREEVARSLESKGQRIQAGSDSRSHLRSPSIGGRAWNMRCTRAGS